MNEDRPQTVPGVITVEAPSGFVTWQLKIGACDDTERFIVEASIDGKNWFPFNGRLSMLHGPDTITDHMKGGPWTMRGHTDLHQFIRVTLRQTAGAVTPIHLQVGTNAYVGVISNKAANTFVIDEEKTLEDLLKGC